MAILVRLAAAVLALSACTVDPASYPRTPSKVIVAEPLGVLANLFRPPDGSTTAESGFTLLSDPQPAFEARAALIATAERSVDLQYYIWAGDRSGVLLAWRVAEAANRGVRVRILIDDFTTKGHDLGLAAVNAQPNVEVRLFNPYARRGVRGLQMLGDFSRLNHRMHNKALIADGQVAIVGGRNIGDHYFGLHGTANFRDLDVLDRLFSDGFATELAALPQGQWAGPVESGYGLHLVRVTEYRPGELPNLVEIRAQVLREWSIEQRQKSSDEFYRQLRAQYSVIIEPAPLVRVIQAAGGAK